MSQEEQDNLESENQEQEAGDSEEQEETSSEQSAESSDDKDYASLYENQKTRAEKAEAKLKEMKKQLSSDESESEDDSQQSSQPLDDRAPKEEAKLYARFAADNMSDEEMDEAVEYARKVAQVEGTSLDEATKSDLFKSWKQSKDASKKQEQSQMGATKGSGYQQQNQKDVSTPGLSDEEHKRFWKQRMGM